MPYTYSFNASACPPVVTPSSFAANTIGIGAAYTAGPTSPVSRGLNAGESAFLRAKLNANFAVVDTLARYGAGVYGVASGLVLSAGVGLLASVSPGTALIDGPVESASALSVAVPNTAASAWVWLLRPAPGGTPTLWVSATPVIPGSPGILLGSVSTAGGAVTGVDGSGVMQVVAGQGTRRTADAGPPTDTPPADASFRAITAAGTFYWAGAGYTGGAGYRTLLLGAVHNVTLTPATNYLVGWDFSGTGGGAFGTDLYSAGMRCSDPNLIVTQSEGQKTASKMFFTLHYPTIAGSTTPVVCPLVPKAAGDGWTGPVPPSGGLTGAWDAVSVIG